MVWLFRDIPHSRLFDYDLDGDLDMYLLNHSTHPNRNYGRGSKRNSVDAKSGDRLYENENGKFRDVSAEVGLHQGIIGYGLGISVGDLNADGFPDLYIGNDFLKMITSISTSRIKLSAILMRKSTEVLVTPLISLWAMTSPM